MAIINFGTSNETFRKLMGNGLTYSIPRFQRDYSWTADEWDDLWQDIVDMLEENGEPAHYMGYLVLQSCDNKKFIVIDGQQRMTTLSILVLAALSCLDKMAAEGIDSEKNNKRREQLRQSYIGYLDPVSLVPQSKLELNRHNNLFYQNYLVAGAPFPRRGLNASEKLLRDAYEWFKNRLEKQAGSSGENVAQFIDQMVDRLFFTVIIVNNELNAFKVFETLNARGVRLSSTDLLKNYLFSVVDSEGAHDTEFMILEESWERITGILGAQSFSEYLRYYWNMRNKLTRKADLFKSVKKEIAGRGEVFDLIRRLDSCAHTYTALRQHTDELWTTSEEKEYIRLLNLFGVRQPLSLLMAAFDKFGGTDRDLFRAVLRAIVIISFRYNVICNQQANEQERIYSQVANGISQGTLKDRHSIYRALKAIYPKDEIFKSAFRDKEIRTSNSTGRQLIKYILSELEKQASGKTFDIEGEDYTIEHILPEHPGPEWDNFDEKQIDLAIHRLGNLALLKSALNRQAGNLNYSSKKPLYAQCDFETTRGIAARYDQWSMDAIIRRQSWMADLAAGVWRLEFPD